MRSPRPVSTPRQSRSKARAVLTGERAAATIELGCRIDAGCVSPARCRAAGRCMISGAVVTSDEQEPQ